MNGLSASVCGIIAGSIGITISCSRNLSRLKCFWHSYITCVALAVVGSFSCLILCILTLFSFGFSHGGASNVAYGTIITEAILSFCNFTVCNYAIGVICWSGCKNDCGFDQWFSSATENQSPKIGNNDAFRTQIPRFDTVTAS